MTGWSVVARAQWLRRVTWIVVALLLSVGLWARFAGLGERPLAIDEYYFLVSTESVMGDGLPDLPGGGYYTRGILLQYLTAAAIAVTGDTGLGLRLIPTLFGLGCVALAFVFGTQIASRGVGFGLAALLFLSSWQVEFARFGRMYAGFQFFTLLFLIGYTWTMAGRGGWRRYLPPVAALFAVATHEMALLLLPLLFIPVLLPGRLQRLGGVRGLVGYAAASATVAAAGLWEFLLFDARSMGVENAMPADYAPEVSAPVTGEVGRFVVPAFPFGSFVDAALANSIVVVGIIGISAGLLLIARKKRAGVEVPHVLAGAALAAAVLHQLAVATLILAFILVQYRSQLLRPPLRSALAWMGVACGVAAAWLLYAGVSTYVLDQRGWIDRSGERVFRSAVHRTFFGSPDFYDPTVAPWMAEVPILSALLVPVLLLAAWWGGARPIGELVARPGFILLYMAVLFGILSQDYATTRYWFFVYPQILAVLLLVGREAGERIARARSWTGAAVMRGGAYGLAGAVLLFGLTDDFNPLHLARVGADDVGYRTGVFARYEALWYAREDTRSPAQFVNEALGNGGDDAAVVVANVPQASYYLEAPHGVFYARDHDRFPRVSRKGGTVDLWSGQRLLSTPDDLRAYTRDRSELWILRDAQTEPVFDIDSVWGERVASVERSYLGPDGFLEVLRVRFRHSPS